MTPPATTRFAPSPTGYLHLGHACSALLNFEAAQESGGSFLLRIEDIDQERCRPHYEAAIHEDLSWLGLSWGKPVLRQSERLAIYQAALDGLAARGLVYRCFRSRRDIAEALSAPHGLPHSVFRGAAMSASEERDHLAASRPYAWRLSLAEAKAALGERFDALSFLEEADGAVTAHPAEPDRLGDVVLGRKDSGTSYHLACVLDDAASGVSHVIRGEDLREAAGLHRLLQELLGLPAPIYRHHPLLTGADGKRLAKRDGALSLRALREAGYSAQDVRAMASQGLQSPTRSLDAQDARS